MVGKQIGNYQILSLLGTGGMGEVFRARDTTLGRDVAIKLLPAFFANDPDRLARFAREAGLLASCRAQYSVSPDGQSFVINAIVGDAIASPITVILNWTPPR